MIPRTATVHTDDGLYSLTYEYDNDGIYPIRREHLGLYVREVPTVVEDELVGRAYAVERERLYDFLEDE